MQTTTQERKETPYVIATMIDQIGKGLRGGLIYVGAAKLVYNCAPHCRDGSYPNATSSINEQGQLLHDCWLMFWVNGKKNETWRMIICYEPNDTYTVRLVKRGTRGRRMDVIEECRDVYCDQLQHFVERMYDDAIKGRNGGWINT
jgi:hypothetical protein